jgi:hypothetical protein
VLNEQSPSRHSAVAPAGQLPLDVSGTGLAHTPSELVQQALAIPGETNAIPMANVATMMMRRIEQNSSRE